MTNAVLASKKNVIIGIIIAIAVLLMMASYFSKKGRIQKQLDLGGHVEVISQNIEFPRPELDYVVKNSKRFSAVTDLKTPLQLNGKVFESNVRIIDAKYPLFGTVQLEKKLAPVFSAIPQKKMYGVAVNKAFLEQTSMKIGDNFAMGGNKYMLRGKIEGLPDASGKKLMADPLLIVRQQAVPGSGMVKNATVQTYRYRVANPQITSDDWEKNYRKAFPNSKVTISKWDQ